MKARRGDVATSHCVRNGQPEAVLIDFGLALDFDHILTTNRTKETSEGFTPPELYAQSIATGA